MVAVDTGGTFTDLILRRGSEIRTLKVPSTPEDPSVAVLEGLRELLDEGEAFRLVHGSTVATNALLERTGARVVLVTNEGFEDLIEIGRQNRDELYALSPSRPTPLVAREARIGISGRIVPDGEEIEPLDAEELSMLGARVGRAESIAVSLLHAYARPDHERAIEAALSGSPAPVSLSSQILPEYREYERTATTVVNAYVRPIISRYLERIEASAGAESIRIMGSDGGALSLGRAAAEPVHTVLSGPAGGVVGAREWGRRIGTDQIMAFDMGGTSTDVALAPGRLVRTREFQIAGLPVAIPVLDIHTVGAGGGSIAQLDPGGALRVGPRSAGADPGPIVYGRGGTELTVTDAHVLLGRLPPDAFLGGRHQLRTTELSNRFGELAGRLEQEPEHTAAGILAVANTAMERALRVISVEKGHDPRDFTLVSFGGAGALHAAELARRLGVRRVLIPPDPGLLSAFGMLAAPVTRERARTVLISSEETEAVDAVLDELAAEAHGEMLDEGHAPEGLSVERQVDARYGGQSFELTVPAEKWASAFHRQHRERYGYDRPADPVVAVTLRVRVIASGDAPPHSRLFDASGPPPTKPVPVFADGQWTEGRSVWRETLRSGHRLMGPALVLEYSSTAWIPSGWNAEVHPSGSLLLTPL